MKGPATCLAFPMAGSAAIGSGRISVRSRSLSDWFTREILPLELVDSRFYHLDTCLCPLSGGELLYFPPAFDRYGQEAIAERIAPERSWPFQKMRP